MIGVENYIEEEAVEAEPLDGLSASIFSSLFLLQEVN
jgi:hypothetical protein